MRRFVSLLEPSSIRGILVKLWLNILKGSPPRSDPEVEVDHARDRLATRVPPSRPRRVWHAVALRPPAAARGVGRHGCAAPADGRDRRLAPRRVQPPRHL